MAKEAIFPGGPPTSTFGIRSRKKVYERNATW